MDSLGALSLASEPPVPQLLNRPPYGRNQSLISFHMCINILGHGMWQLVVLLVFLYAGAGERMPYHPCELQSAVVCALTEGTDQCNSP